MIKMEICIVIGCENSVLVIRDSARVENMKGLYGYCQIHYLEGTVKEELLNL